MGCPGSSTRCSVTTECASFGISCGFWPAVLDLDRDQAVAEHLAQMREAFRGNELVAGEAHRQHAQLLAVGDEGEVGIRETERALARLSHRERQRGLTEHRGEHRVVDRHRECEPSGEAHADGADSRSAALFVQIARERS